MSENTSAGDHPLGPIDGTQQYITERPYGDGDGETVGGSSPSDEGRVSTDSWPTAVDADPDELSDATEAVIRAAASPALEWESTAELSRAAAPDKDRTFARAQLAHHWPGALERIKEDPRGGDVSVTVDDVAEMRSRVLRGQSANGIASDFGLSSNQTLRHIRGETSLDLNNPPALKHTDDGWVVDRSNDDRVADRSNDDEAQEVAVKPGRSVYHLCGPDGEPLCQHAAATKPGTTSNGFLRAEMTDVSGEWTCCKECESYDGPLGEQLRYDELIGFIKRQVGISEQSGSLKKDHLVEIAREIADSEEALREEVAAFVEDRSRTEGTEGQT